ncbi:carboxypeptidase regulatory-like domain-containing protein [bacterium]|nr:carboxypeptidase regulatory-like domain-containing protein [bacterium]
MQTFRIALCCALSGVCAPVLAGEASGGRVLTSTGAPVSGYPVIIELEDDSSIVALTDENGEWSAALDQAPAKGAAPKSVQVPNAQNLNWSAFIESSEPLESTISPY